MTKNNTMYGLRSITIQEVRMEPCINCGESVAVPQDYKEEYCCVNGECGCMGLPTNPTLCLECDRGLRGVLNANHKQECEENNMMSETAKETLKRRYQNYMAHHEQRRFDGDYNGEYYSLAFEIANTLSHCGILIDFLTEDIKDYTS